MPYEFNPLLPDGFQKKSAVTPADIARLDGEISDLQNTTTDLKQKKVTKFFSANDYLSDNEIAQYQGEDDAVNNLTNGFFYKKNPAFTITPNSDTFAYNVNRIMNIRNFDGTSFQQYYLGEVNISTSDYKIIGTSDDTVHTVAFNPSLFISNYLPATPDGAMVFYPYLLVNGVWDYDNPVTVANGHYVYKDNVINLTQRYAGLIGAGVGADMTSPYRRYLWASILLPDYQACFAFPYATNSSNELIALGVSNGLGAFGFQAYYTISSIASTTINVQGVDLTANPAFTAVQTDEVPEASESQAGLLSAADKMFINQISAQEIRIFYVKNYNFSDSANLVDACKTLINEIETTQKTPEYQIFEGTLLYDNLYLYRGSAYPNFSMLQYSVFTITNIATGNSYKFGYSGRNWYFNSL